jgi:hypothetical protein
VVRGGKPRIIRFRSIVHSSTAGLKRGIGISSFSISDLTYFSTNVHDHHFNGPQRKPIEGIPRQGSNYWSTPWSQLSLFVRAESNAIRVGTAQITVFRLSKKPVE